MTLTSLATGQEKITFKFEAIPTSVERDTITKASVLTTKPSQDIKLVGVFETTCVLVCRIIATGYLTFPTSVDA